MLLEPIQDKKISQILEKRKRIIEQLWTLDQHLKINKYLLEECKEKKRELLQEFKGRRDG